MKVDSVSEKVILTSIAASVALSLPLPSDAAQEKNVMINRLTINANEKFSYGQQGFKIHSIQQKLVDHHVEGAVEENGVFGLKTHAAIRQFQKFKKLQVDGVAGPETLTALFINKDIEEVEVEDHILVKIEEGQLFSYGDQGDAIKEIQKLLKSNGYYLFETDGIFGSNTKEAVKNYQKENGLLIDGIIGEQTYQHLTGVSLSVTSEPTPAENLMTPVFSNEEENLYEVPAPFIVSSIVKAEKNDIHQVDYLVNGDSGQAVKDLQSMLKRKGYYPHPVDGFFGPITEAAVRDFQINNQLQVDGIAGTVTIKHLTSSSSLPMTSRSSRETQSIDQQEKIASDISSNSIIQYGKSLIGTRYIWGGTTPNGFDCSGFLMYVYKKNGVNLPRTVGEIWNYGQSVSKLQPGDLVFFETYKKGPSHAGIYLGNQQFLHAGSSTGVTISDMNMSYWSSRYLGAKRIH